MLRASLLLLVGSLAWAQAGTVARRAFASLVKLPLEPPEVQAEINEVRKEEELRVEDLSWQSLDGERVPAYLIRPAVAEGRLPAVICLHGSSGSRESMTTKEFGTGKWIRFGRQEPHTRLLGWARELARRGYVTLAITQRGLDRREPPINTQANVLLAQGRTAMGAILHEIRQGISFLAGRPDVDSGRIAATGMSFGGITAFYTWLLDDRVAAAAPICGGIGSVELFSRKGRISYHGTYWWVPGMLERGDQADFAAAMAPRPLMLWAPTEDVGMPREAVDRFVAKVAPAYEQTGRSEAFVVHQPAGDHAFTIEAFDALVRFLDKIL